MARKPLTTAAQTVATVAAIAATAGKTLTKEQVAANKAKADAAKAKADAANKHAHVDALYDAWASGELSIRDAGVSQLSQFKLVADNAGKVTLALFQSAWRPGLVARFASSNAGKMGGVEISRIQHALIAYTHGILPEDGETFRKYAERVPDELRQAMLIPYRELDGIKMEVGETWNAYKARVAAIKEDKAAKAKAAKANPTLAQGAIGTSKGPDARSNIVPIVVAAEVIEEAFPKPDKARAFVEACDDDDELAAAFVTAASVLGDGIDPIKAELVRMALMQYPAEFNQWIAGLLLDSDTPSPATPKRSSRRERSA